VKLTRDQPLITIECLYDLMATLLLPLLGQPCLTPSALAVNGNDNKIHDVTMPLWI
jgi:hypothetical protein